MHSISQHVLLTGLAAALLTGCASPMAASRFSQSSIRGNTLNAPALPPPPDDATLDVIRAYGQMYRTAASGLGNVFTIRTQLNTEGGGTARLKGVEATPTFKDIFNPDSELALQLRDLVLAMSDGAANQRSPDATATVTPTFTHAPPPRDPGDGTTTTASPAADRPDPSPAAAQDSAGASIVTNGEQTVSVTWYDRDISTWPATVELAAAIENGQIVVAFEHADWPTVHVGAEVNANPWIVAQAADGQWYAQTFEWLRPTQDSKPLSSIPHGLKSGPLSGMAIASGQTYGFAVSSIARLSKDSGLHVRSPIVWVTAP